MKHKVCIVKFLLMVCIHIHVKLLWECWQLKVLQQLEKNYHRHLDSSLDAEISLSHMNRITSAASISVWWPLAHHYLTSMCGHRGTCLMSQWHENHMVLSPVPCRMFGHLPARYSVGCPLSWPHDTGHCAAGCYCHWVYPDIGFWSYIDFEVSVLSLSCTAVLSILFYRSVCVFRDYNAVVPSIPTQHMWSGLRCTWLVLCIGGYTLDYKYVQFGQTTTYYMNGKNTSWRRMNYRISRPIRCFFPPWKMWPKFDYVLCAEGKYYFQTYKCPYTYYTSLSWYSEICFQIMRSGITACEWLSFLSWDLH
jgi:hypothetical protein